MSDERLIRIEDKIDRIAEDIGEMKVVQAKHEENLRTHMKRSDTLEAHLDILRKETEPLKEHVLKTNAVFKFIGWIMAVGTALLGILRFFRKI